MGHLFHSDGSSLLGGTVRIISVSACCFADEEVGSSTEKASSGEKWRVRAKNSNKRNTTSTSGVMLMLLRARVRRLISMGYPTGGDAANVNDFLNGLDKFRQTVLKEMIGDMRGKGDQQSGSRRDQGFPYTPGEHGRIHP